MTNSREGEPPLNFSIQSAFQELSTINARIEDIEDAKPCYDCGKETSKALIDYQYDYQSHPGIRMTITKTLPGYACNGCPVEYYDSGLANRFLNEVANGLVQLGDNRLRRSLDLQGVDPRTYTTFTPIPPEVEKQI